MDRNAENYILFKRTLGHLLIVAHRNPDPLTRMEYRQKYEDMLARDSDYKVDDMSDEQQREVMHLERLTSLYDDYLSELSDMRKSEIFLEIISLYNDLGLSLNDSSDVL
ncbi:hypothetical protein [Paenibacillus periandrae]|uniref:hypothetical protein n=1 Tax=Paenibacillus periandrae TaxID=1761741 RepID=UPI001F08BF85|nr:hypothetical protein [Paenibacillus periandrae]